MRAMVITPGRSTMSTKPRARDTKGRFIATPKPKPLSPQCLGDAEAWTFLEEAEPPNCLATRAEYRVHRDWWQALKG